MGIGDVYAVDAAPNRYYVDTEIGTNYKRSDHGVGWGRRKKRNVLEDDEAVIDHVLRTFFMGGVWTEPKATEEVILNVRGILNYLKNRSGE